MRVKTASTNAFARHGKLARNSAFNLGGQLLTALAAFISIPIVFRQLGTERFGLLSLMWSALATTIVLDLGTGPAVARATAASLVKDQGQRIAAIMRAGTLLQLALGIAAALLIIATGPLLLRLLNIPAPLRPDARLAIYPFALTIPLVLVAQSHQGFLEGLERFDLLAYVRTPVLVATYIIPAVGAVLGWSLATIMVGLLISRLLALVALHALYRDALPASQNSHLRAELPGLFRYGRWLALSGIFGQVLIYLDRFLLSAFHGPAAVAQYAAPYDAAGKLLVLPGSVGVAMFPGMAKDAVRDNTAAAVARSRGVTRFTLWLLLPLCVLLVLAAGPLLHLWLGPNLTDQGVNAFRVLVMAVLLHALAYPALILVEAIGRSDVIARYYFFELLCYAPLAVLAVWQWGVPGAAWLWLVRNVVFVSWAHWYMHRHVPKRRSGPVEGYVHAE